MNTEQATDILAENRILKAKLSTTLEFIDMVKGVRKKKSHKTNSQKKRHSSNLISEIKNENNKRVISENENDIDIMDLYEDFLDSKRYKRACKKYNIKQDEYLDDDIENKLFDSYMIDYEYQI